MFVFLSVILLLIVVALSFDYYDIFLNWFQRIKIGQQNNNEQWKKSIENVIVKWTANGTPNVDLNENKKLKIIDIIRDKMNGEISSVSYWQDASILKAASKINNGTIDFNSFAERYFDMETGEWLVDPTHINSAMLCYEIMCCNEIENESVKPALDYVAAMLENLAEKYGTVPYNESIPDCKFVDTVGMICPFLIKYAAEYDKKEYIDISVNQIREFAKKGIDDKLLLAFHCYDDRNENKLGICGWGRGCAWWAYGVTESLKALLSVDGYNKEKAFLLKQSIAILDAMEKYFRADGSLGRIVLEENSLQDNSAAAILAYCYSYMYKLTKSEKYSALLKSITEHLKYSTRRNGVIDYSQGDTAGIGFYSASLGVIPATQGFAVCAIWGDKND